MLNPRLPIAAVIAASLLSLSACKPSATGPGATPAGAGPGGGAGGKKGPVAFPVETQVVGLRTVEYVVAAVGGVAAFEESQVVARVAGAVETVSFAEGATVTTEQILVEIEPRRFQLALDQAKAQLQRAQAIRDDAHKSLRRREKLGPEVAAVEEVDTYRAKVATAEADIAAGKAAVGVAELNLRDSRVRATAPGVIQTRKVVTGQYVQPGTVLATLLRTDPLLLRFQVSVADARRMEPGMSVKFSLRGVPGLRTATVSHIAASAEESTRMVGVIAHVDAPDGASRPGAFAEVSVPVRAPAPAMVIPQQAVRPSEKGFLAYTIVDNKAHENVLQLGMRTPEGLVEVTSGLEDGAQLVIVGAEALKEGAAVKVAPPKIPGPGQERKDSPDLAPTGGKP